MKRSIYLLAATWLLCVPGIPSSSAQDYQHPVLAATADLNGDGKPDKIRLTPFRVRDKKGEWNDDGDFCLNVNGQTVYGKLPGAEAEGKGFAAEGFYIADIDKTDRYKEIVVTGDVPSDFETTAVFWYDGRKLHYSGSPETGWGPDFKGDGTAVVIVPIGFWQPHLRYRLDKNHVLNLVKQNFYPVNVKGKVYSALKLRQNRRSAKVIATLPVGSWVEIVKSDMEGWYFIQSSDGPHGWIKEEDVRSHLNGFPVAN